MRRQEDRKGACAPRGRHVASPDDRPARLSPVSASAETHVLRILPRPPRRAEPPTPGGCWACWGSSSSSTAPLNTQGSLGFGSHVDAIMDAQIVRIRTSSTRGREGSGIPVPPAHRRGCFFPWPLPGLPPHRKLWLRPGHAPATPPAITRSLGDLPMRNLLLPT